MATTNMEGSNCDSYTIDQTKQIQELDRSQNCFNKSKDLSFSLPPPLIPTELSQSMNMGDQKGHCVGWYPKYKCYKCFGKKDGAALPLCKECKGTHYILQSHPMAVLLSKVLNSKLPSLTESVDQPLSSVPCLDSSLECSNCLKCIQSDDALFCSTCPDYILCHLCFEEKRYIHMFGHKFIKIPMHLNQIRLKELPTMKRISEELELEDYTFQEEIYCTNCSEAVEECYEACLNCENENKSYIICNSCVTSNSFTHSREHKLVMRTTTKQSKLPDLFAKPSNSSSVVNIRTSMDYEIDGVSPLRRNTPMLQSIICINHNDSVQMDLAPAIKKNHGLLNSTNYTESVQIDNMPPLKKTSSLLQSIICINQNESAQMEGVSPLKKHGGLHQSIICSNQGQRQHVQIEASPLKKTTPLLQSIICINHSELDISIEHEDLRLTPLRPPFTHAYPAKVDHAPKQSFSLQDSGSFNPQTFQFVNFSKRDDSRKLNKMKGESIVDIIMQESQNSSRYGERRHDESEYRIAISSLGATNLSIITSNVSMNNLSSLSRKSSSRSNHQEQYIFSNYQCDICGTSPIKNKRYHCKQCQDYDICHACFTTAADRHNHNDYQQIQGKALLRERELKVTRLRETFQRHSQVIPRKNQIKSAGV